MKREQYVLGFLFDLGFLNVVLIEKTHPEWQKGKLNGIGGLVKKDEDLVTAMVREFGEETGVVTEKSDWTYVLTSRLLNVDIEVFATHDNKFFPCVTTITEEKVGIIPLPMVMSNLVPLVCDVNSIISLCIQRMLGV